jgi:uncharacterized protein
MAAVEQYAPSFVIRVNGVEFRHGVTVDVLSVSVTDTCDRADSFSFTLRDRNPEPGHFAGGSLTWLDDGVFDEGNHVTIELGYVNQLDVRFGGELTACAPTFPENGVPTLTVRGYSYYQRLQHRRRDKPFEKATDSQIAQEIAKEVGLGSSVKVTDIQYPLVSPKNSTLADFLSRRAKRIGYELVVKENMLYFERPGYQTAPGPALTLEWGKSLRSFSPSLSTYNMVTEVKVQGPQTSQGGGKQPLVGIAKPGDERVKLGKTTGPQVALKMLRQNALNSDEHSVINQQEANLLALAQLEANALEFINGRGSCIGDPRLKARIVIELAGLGQRFSGLYYVTSATHTIDAGGYRTDFEVKRNAR